MKSLIAAFLFFLIPGIISGQDTSKPWFPDDDDGFYGYLADRLQGLGIDRPILDQNGTNIVFEFTVDDSGYIDTVHILQCFDSRLSYAMRMILLTMPRVNAKVENGKTISEKKMYNLIVKLFADGYRVDPNTLVPQEKFGSTPKGFRWMVAFVAVVALLVVVVK